MDKGIQPRPGSAGPITLGRNSLALVKISVLTSFLNVKRLRLLLKENLKNVLCLIAGMYICCGMPVEVRGQLGRMFLSPSGLQGSNSGCQAFWQVPSPSEPSLVEEEGRKYLCVTALTVLEPTLSTRLAWVLGLKV